MILSILSLSAQKKEVVKTEDKITGLETKLSTVEGIEKIQTLSELAVLYADRDSKKAVDLVNQGLKLAKKEKADNSVKAGLYNSLGAAYFYEQNYKKSAQAYEDEYEIIAVTGTNKQKIESMFNIATLYAKSNKNKKAEEYYLKSLKLSTELKLPDYEMINYKALYELYTNWEKYKEALNYFNLYLSMKDTQFKQETNKKISILRWNYQFEKRKRIKTEVKLQETDSALSEAGINQDMLRKDTLMKSEAIKYLNYEVEYKAKEIELSKTEIALKDQIMKTQRTRLISITIIAAFILLATILLLILYRKIRIKNKLLSEQKKEIEYKNLQIMDSINYAKRIQTSILIPEQDIQKFLPDFFLFYEPKDIVSGDFYWFSQVENKCVIAAIDCTGHGVPGAFMSMIGNTLLNEIVNEKLITKPDEILTMLHNSVLKALQQNKEMETEDGMDMSLCTIDTKLKRFQFAGAKNHIYVIQSDNLKVLKANQFSIGGKPMREGQEIRFTYYDFMYDDNTSIYMLSDGYLDQFGGLEDTKFNSVRFKQMLIDNRNLSMMQQKQVIKNTMLEWKGNRDQVDDILVMGIKLS